MTMTPIFIVLVLIFLNLPKSPESSDDMQEKFWLKADREQRRKERRERRRKETAGWSRWWHR